MQFSLYASDDCSESWLHTARRNYEVVFVGSEKKISFQKFDVDTADGKRALAQSGGGRGIPVLLANGEKVQGFSRSAYDQVFARTR